MRKTRIRLALASLATLTVTVLPAQNVVTDWTAIASSTIKSEGKAADAFLYFAYTSIAVYDATNSIHRRFKPFYFAGTKDRDASVEAAAVSAAHTVLVYYFPDQQTSLDAQFQQSLDGIIASAEAKREGVEAGVESAQTLINERTNDGREADITYNWGTGPGDWQPTPSRPVKSRIGVRTFCRRRRRVTSRPSMNGIITSSTMMSNP
jgi:hypothetical protein